MKTGTPLKDILRRVDPRFEAEIRGAKNRFRQTTGANLANSMRLHLQHGSNQAAVRVDIEPGHPRSLARFVHENWDAQAEHLILARSMMECYLRDCSGLMNHFRAMPTNSEAERMAVEGWLQDMDKGRALVQQILDYAKGQSIVAELLAIDEDILGTYSFEDGAGRVRIYWAVVAFVALSLGIHPVDLALVVLAHELAHAFTHLGHDADGHTWIGFFAADRTIAEGLAQYYTHLFVHTVDLKGRELGVRKAYEALTPLQPPTYQRHLQWNEQWDPEAIRAAMLEYRNETRGNRDEFEERIAFHARRLAP